MKSKASTHAVQRVAVEWAGVGYRTWGSQCTRRGAGASERTLLDHAELDFVGGREADNAPLWEAVNDSVLRGTQLSYLGRRPFRFREGAVGFRQLHSSQ
jgi:hypothetical protein